MSHVFQLMAEVNLFHKNFVNEVRRCEEMERQIRFIEREMIKENVKIIKHEGENPTALEPSHMVDLEAVLERQEESLKAVTDNMDAMKMNYFQLTEMKNVLTHAVELFSYAPDEGTEAHDALGGLEGDIDAKDNASFHARVEFLAGVLDQQKLGGFMRTLWCGCRNNALLRFTPASDEFVHLETGHLVRKVVFVVFFQGQQLQLRIKKICEGYRANLYPCPEVTEERQVMLDGVLTRLQDMNMVLSESADERLRILRQQSDNLNRWSIRVRKTKAIFHTMNMFCPQGKHFVAEGWCPVDQRTNIQNALKEASESSESSMPSLIHQLDTDSLPSYHRTNKFTAAYQAIINSYGVPSYGEMNPAPFSLITFPFLFSVMFGDLGHGSIMLLFAIWMLFNEKKFTSQESDNEIWTLFFGGRYLIFLMGLFSVYAGIIYNDTFSKSMNIFGSAWSAPYDADYLQSQKSLMLDPADNMTFSGAPYPFGIDPIWQISHNKITFSNSYKKKISVIFGLMQMYLGIFISLANNIHFKKKLNIFCEFIPQVLFLTSIFGYLVTLMIVKWVIFKPSDSGCAPSLLIGLINMFLLSYPTGDCSIMTWYPHQKDVEHALLAIVVICVPWLLLVKPLYLRYQHNKMKRVQSFVSTTANEDFNFGEEMVHQSIHTIEFCLNCISHTASYLRLWALSLAHTQLSEVLWNMVLQMGLKMNGYLGCIFLFCLFVPWAVLTVAILLLMEGLSAFLHTLRLHWVEFQSKFYQGEGIKFEPLHFKEILQHKDDSTTTKKL